MGQLCNGLQKSLLAESPERDAFVSRGSHTTSQPSELPLGVGERLNKH